MMTFPHRKSWQLATRHMPFCADTANQLNEAKRLSSHAQFKCFHRQSKKSVGMVFAKSTTTVIIFLNVVFVSQFTYISRTKDSAGLDDYA